MDSYAALADIYDEWSSPMTEDVPFYVGLARQADGPVVELAIGTGRVAVSVAQAIGRPVIGLDTSPAMLQKARQAARDAGVELDLREGDMRELSLDDGRARRHLGSDDLWELIEHTPADSRVDITVFAGRPGAEPRTITLWWTTKSEWEGLVDVSGLETEALYGWFDQRPFDDDSREFVWVARKPG